MKQFVFLFLLFSSLLFSDIDELIESMQTVSDEERFKIMNHFKQEVIKLQEEERMEAMLKLISITQSNNAKEVLEELRKGSRDNNSSDEIEEHEGLEDAVETGEVIQVHEGLEYEIEQHEVENEIEENEIEDDD